MEPVVVGTFVIGGVVSFIISHEVRSAARYRSTARSAALVQVASFLGVVGGLFYAFQLQVN